MKQIFPKEIVQSTVEIHRYKHKVTSKIIYSILLLSMLCIGLALPHLYIDIYSSSKGILKAEKERNQISSLYSGKIQVINIKENLSIKQDDTLLVIDDATTKEKLHLITNQLDETKTYLRDLEFLTNTNKLSLDSLQSFLYKKKINQYIQKINELEIKLINTERVYNRQKKLYNKGVIAKVKYENSRYNLELARSVLNHFKKQQLNQWQTELTQQTTQKNELKSTLLQYQKEHDNYTIKAPISGTIQNLKGLEAGNFINAGSILCEISPDTNLIAECYVSPADIGLLKTANQVKFQIEAFNYNQWGMATGKILSINKDISVINDTPLFKVICSIEQKNLQLKNGFKGTLKKGMTLNARFFITNRSAFDLLYDKVDDWFNPSKIKS